MYKRNEALYYAGYWVVLAVVLVELLNFYGYSGTEYLLDVIISCILLAGISLLVLVIFSAYQPVKDALLYWILLIFLAKITWGLADKWLVSTFVYAAGQRAWVEHSMPVRYFIGAFNIIGLMAVAYYRGKGKAYLEREEQRSEREQSVKEAELYKLRQQLHPHFLFNSLNSINALIHSNPEKARKMIQQLSAFLRGTLKQEENHFVSLDEEVAYLELYLNIEKVRFGHRLKTEFDLSEEALKSEMPPLLLQPLMENAIKHGLYGVTGDVVVSLKARYIKPYLIVSLSNPYEKDQPFREGTGFGLTSIRRRLYLLFGRDDLLEIDRQEEQFEVIFRIPQKEKI